MTAAVESVSPSICSGRRLRMLTSPENFQSSVAMAPFIRTPAAATIIIIRWLDGDRGGETVDGGYGDRAGEDNQGERVDEGGKDTGALVAEGLVGGGGTGLQVDGDEAEAECEEVGEIVAGFRQQRERMRAEAEPGGREDVEQR